MDFVDSIRITRERVREAQSSYSDGSYKQDRIKKPLMFYVTFDRRFDPQFRDQRILLERGRVVWGAIIQANEILFEHKGPCDNLPAAIMYSTGDDYDSQPERLVQHAHSLFDLKGKPCSPEMQAFGDKLANEIVADIKLAVPPGFTDGAETYYATLLMARKHLPFKYLASNFFPVLIAPEQTDSVMGLPKEYWDPDFKRSWAK